MVNMVTVTITYLRLQKPITYGFLKSRLPNVRLSAVTGEITVEIDQPTIIAKAKASTLIPKEETEMLAPNTETVKI